MLAQVAGEFGIVTEPDLQFSDKGNAWIKLRCVSKDRVRAADGTWGDGPATFIDIVAMGKLAENLMESVKKGDSIVVTGKLSSRDWEKDGEKRTTYRITADNVGVSVRWNPVGSVMEQAVKAVEEELGGAPF
jgi:single-strand DNA-binding protein